MAQTQDIQSGADTASQRVALGALPRVYLWSIGAAAVVVALLASLLVWGPGDGLPHHGVPPSFQRRLRNFGQVGAGRHRRRHRRRRRLDDRRGRLAVRRAEYCRYLCAGQHREGLEVAALAVRGGWPCAALLCGRALGPPGLHVQRPALRRLHGPLGEHPGHRRADGGGGGRFDVNRPSARRAGRTQPGGRTT